MGKPENPEELGWQMNEADKTEKDFDSFDDYREYLDREYPFDKDAFNAQTEEQKAACRYAGMAGVMHEISEMKKIDPKLTAPALGVLTGAATSLGWSPETTRAFTQGMMTSLGGSGELFTKLPEFAKGMLDGADAVKLSDGVKAGVQESGVDTADTVKDAMGTATSANENL